MQLAPFIRALRAEGWETRYDSRSKHNGRIIELHKWFGQRDVQVQLHDDGLFRTTHMVYSDRAKRRGRMSTSPTIFRCVPGMWQAVQHERVRTDHPPVKA